MELEKKSRPTSVYALMVKFGTIVFAGILVCIIISNFSVFSPNWPFALFASFSGTFILILPFTLMFLLNRWRRAILPIVLLALFAFYPFYSFEEFVTPMEHDCIADECISVVAANLGYKRDALEKLAHTKAKDADILIIVEFPYSASPDELLALFPMDGEGQITIITEKKLRLGSRIAVMSRKSLDDVNLKLHQFPNTELRQRGIVSFNYTMTSGEPPLSFVIVHPPSPRRKATIVSRDAYLYEASGSLSNTSNFIMIGDFNMTPWESNFSSLPGKRVGNPRWTRTWNARRYWQHIAIDHALVGEDVGVSEAYVLPDVGSDHFPIYMVVHAK